MPTHTTGSGGRRLIDPLDHHPQPRRRLGERAGELPVWPLAALLVGLLAQADPGLEVAHLPHRDPRDALARAAIRHRARLGVPGHQRGSPASGRGAQRLTLRQGRRGETPQGDEAHEALGGRLLVGHAPSFPHPRSTQEHTGCSLEQMAVYGEGVMHPRHL